LTETILLDLGPPQGA